MQVYFVVYSKATGEILRSGACPEQMVELQTFNPDTEESLVTAEFSSDALHYVVDSAVVPRPEFAVDAVVTLLANSTDSHTVTLPDPCNVTVDGEAQVVTGGELVLTSDMPAEYNITLAQWPYLDKTFKVVANAA